jgi:hypothetical protein
MRRIEASPDPQIRASQEVLCRGTCYYNSAMSVSAFESPIPGRIGAYSSKLNLLGTMMLFVARRPDEHVDDGSISMPGRSG